MSDTELKALQKQLAAGFEAINHRLAALEKRIDDGFLDTHRGVHGMMVKLLTVAGINEIRSKMANPPDLAEFPFWAMR